MARGKQPPSVGEMMTRRLVTIAPTTDVREAVGIFMRRGYSLLPVVERGDRLMGVFSQRDCIQILCEALYEDWPEGHVADHMTQSVERVTPDEDAFALAKRFLRGARRGYPVVEEGRLVGVVTRGDLLRALERAIEAEGRPPRKSTYELIEERRRS